MSAASPRRRGRLAGVASYRVAAMKQAETKNDAALTTNATLRPTAAVTRPPIDAPSASIADQVALDSALAGSSSSADVTLGIVAVRAGSKNAWRGHRQRHHDVRDPDLIGAAHEQQAEDQAAAHQVGRDHQPAPVHAIDDHARQRTDERDRQELHDHHPRDGGGRPGQIEQQRVDGDGVEPVAELRDRLADVQQPEVPVARAGARGRDSRRDGPV